MALPSRSLFIYPILILITKAISQPENKFLRYLCIDKNGYYTNNSAYQTNLNSLLSALTTNNGNGYGFYNLSGGSGSDKVNVIGLCRGDKGYDDCRSCLDSARQLLPALCLNSKEAVGLHISCMLRYSNRTILGIPEINPLWTLNNWPILSSNVEVFYNHLIILLDDLKNRASSAGSLRKYAANSTLIPNFTTIYALVQCTPDLSPKDCSFCLDTYFGMLGQCCNARVGARLAGPCCGFKYLNQPFYEKIPHLFPPSLDSLPPTVSSSSPPQANTTTTPENGSNASTIIVIVAVSSATAFVVLIVSAFIYVRMKNKKKNIAKIESAVSLQFSFETIRVATDDFSLANMLGQGGFGPVYKGRLSDGQLVAVKRLSMGSGQGDLEFKNEVMLVAKLQHRNLVRLLGFCLEGSERLLVYEFVPNGSLDHFIFDPRKRPSLDWESRYKIIRGTARGLLYLHEDSRLRIIHRDLKASNILLDEEMHPKIADFGMARLFHVDQTQGSTSRIVGTYGYMAPEYLMHGQFSVKSDVYSFGVLLLEIVSGLKNSCSRQGEQMENLLSYAWRSWRDQTAVNIVDPLLGQSPVSDTIRCIHIALLCVQENVANRPTMNTVVLMLNSNSISLPVPSKPGFFMRSTTEFDSALPLNYNSSVTNESDHSISTGPAQAYSANEASISELYPR